MLANATLFARPSETEMVIVELDGIAKQADGAPQGRVYGVLEDVVTLAPLSYALSMQGKRPAGTGQRDEQAAQERGCDIIRCFLDCETMTARFDGPMNEGDSAYDFRSLTDGL